eukprot:g8647.t1
MENGATLIQAIVRAKIFAYRFVQERKIEVKAEEMAREMDRQKESEELRFLRLYKQQIEKYWRDQKKEHDEKMENERKFMAQKYEIKLLRAHNRWQKQDDTKEDIQNDLNEIDEAEWEVWRAEWASKADKAAEAEESRIIGLCEGRGGRSERDRVDGRDARAFVSDFIFDIMKRFRNAGVPLSREDAKMKAYEAVKKKYNERMREEVAEAQEVDRLRIEDEKQKKAEAKQREENKVEADRRLKAIISLQSHWRKNLAVKELRKRIRRFFVKLYSTEHYQYYYEHRVSEVIFWSKPKIFGVFDLPLPKNWYFFEDEESNQHYYVKPKTGVVKWEMPEGCISCQQHSLRFAKYFCQDCGIMICEKCNIGDGSYGSISHENEAHNRLKLNEGLKYDIPNVVCTVCNILEPTGTCRDCNDALYCDSCFRAYHTSPHYPDMHNHELTQLL